MGDRILHDIILRNIDEKDKQKHSLEERRDELSVALQRYQAASDEFKDRMDLTQSSGQGFHLLLSELLEAERGLEEQTKENSDSSWISDRIATCREQLQAIEKKYSHMQEEEYFGDAVEQDMANELREIISHIEDLDAHIEDLMRRVFNTKPISPNN